MFPDQIDFLATFGMEIDREDRDTGCQFYTKKSADGIKEIKFSFSKVMRSFDVALLVNNIEAMRVTSECMKYIKFWNNGVDSGIDVYFDISGFLSVIKLKFYQDIHCEFSIINI